MHIEISCVPEAKLDGVIVFACGGAPWAIISWVLSFLCCVLISIELTHSALKHLKLYSSVVRNKLSSESLFRAISLNGLVSSITVFHASLPYSHKFDPNTSSSYQFLLPLFTMPFVAGYLRSAYPESCFHFMDGPSEHSRMKFGQNVDAIFREAYFVDLSRRDPPSPPPQPPPSPTGLAIGSEDIHGVCGSFPCR